MVRAPDHHRTSSTTIPAITTTPTASFSSSSSSFVARKFRFHFVFLCSQLTWILPLILTLSLFFFFFFFFFFFNIRITSPSILITEYQNASLDISTVGFTGPLRILSEIDTERIEKIRSKWTEFWPTVKEDLKSKGFLPPQERTCYMWLPDCHTIAKHEKIVQIVKQAIGPSVLLYGMSVWKGRNKYEALHRFHRDGVVTNGCQKTINFISGANVKLISQSHKIPERLSQALLRSISLVEDESLKLSNKQDQLAFLEHSFSARIKKMIRTPNIWLENLEIEDGYGVFFHGGSTYRVEEVVGDNTGLLLQFISGDCKVREQGDHAWGSHGTSNVLYMPPVLLVAGDSSQLGASNDVRLKLILDEKVKLKPGNGDVLGNLLGSTNNGPIGYEINTLDEIHNITVFSGLNAATPWEEGGIWKSRLVGEAWTKIMGWGRIKHFFLGSKRKLAMDFGTVTGDGEQVILVVREGLLYVRAINDDGFQFSEILELRPGSAVLLSKRLLHAFVPLDPETAFVSFRWQNLFLKPWRDDKKAKLHDVGIGVGPPNSMINDSSQATQGCTIVLSSGQAYDPDNNENCDVMVFVVEGEFLQILPSNVTLRALDALLIPANETCILWNISGSTVKLFAIHICSYEDTMQIMTSFGASGKIF